MAVSPGFRPDHVLTGQISLPVKQVSGWPARLAFTERLMDSIGSQPGVLAAGVVNNVPFSGNSGKSAATVKGHVSAPGESPRGHYSYGVDGDYFRAMGFSLRAGRFLTAPIRAAASASVSWTRTSRATTGRTPALLASTCSGLRSRNVMPKHSPSSASSAQ